MQQRKQGYYLLYPSQDTQEVLSEGKNMMHTRIFHACMKMNKDSYSSHTLPSHHGT